MSYNLLSGSVNFVGTRQGTVEDLVDTHTTQTVAGAKTFTFLTGTNAFIANTIGVNNHATDHALSVTGDISGSGNISGSAFWGDGSNLTGIDKVVTALNNATQNELLVVGSTITELDAKNTLTYDGTKLAVTGAISGSGNISGSAFYGSWAGANILGSQVQKASNGAIGDSSGLTLTTTGVTAQNSPASSAKVFIDESGIKYSTIANILANNAAVTSLANAGTSDRVLTSNGAGAINSEQYMTFNETAGLKVLNAMPISGSGLLQVAGDALFESTVAVTGNLSASSAWIADYVYHQGDDNTYVGFGLDDNFKVVAGGTQMITAYGNLSTKRTQIEGGDFKVNTSGLDFYITSSTGYVGIGVSDPDSPLEVLSTAAQFKLSYDAANAAQFTVASNGNLTINPNGTTTVDSALGVNGNTTLGDASGDIVTINGTGVTIPNGLNFDSNTLFISSSSNRIGVGTVNPSASLDILSTTEQLRLSYDAANFTQFEVNSSGNITVDPVNSMTLKGDLIIKDGSEETKTIVQIFDNQDDGLIGGYAGGSDLNVLIHANGMSYIKGGGLTIGESSGDHSFNITGSAAISGSLSLSSTTPTAAGAGFTSGSQDYSIANINGEIVTTILLSLSSSTGGPLSSNGCNADKKIIGNFSGASNAYMTKLTSAKNGYIYKASMSCIETPTGGEPDIDLVVSSNANGQGTTYDGGGGTNIALITVGDDWAQGTYQESSNTPADPSSLVFTNGLNDLYLYIAVGASAGHVQNAYTAGKFVIKLYGASF